MYAVQRARELGGGTLGRHRSACPASVSEWCSRGASQLPWIILALGNRRCGWRSDTHTSRSFAPSRRYFDFRKSGSLV